VKYKIRAAAEHDLDGAASWYRENATNPRTPLRFLLEVRATFELIAESPGVFAEIHDDIRRCPVRAFPGYAVFRTTSRPRCSTREASY
jgi:plasmid stabilization system protein ParE